MRQYKRRILSIFILAISLLGLYLYGLFNPSIPILMYHHVNEYKGDMVTISPVDFEKQMAYLKDNFNTIYLSELLSYLKKGKGLPPHTCVITFDDGYYDNFVYAYPILKKYNLKATIFAISSRVGEERNGYEIKNHYESNLAGALKGCAGRPSENFLTWGELKEMEESGLIDIESHTLTHARYFVSPTIRDFNSGDFPWWLPLATSGDIRLGIPLYQDEKALLARRYFDDGSLRHYLGQYVKEKGGEKFFNSRKKEEWLNELFLAVEEYQHKCGPLKGYFESEEDRKKRLGEELYLSKKEIEKRLGKECQFLAWPWGKYNDELVSLAKSYGYKGAVTTEKGANIFGLDPMYLKRFDIKKGDLGWFKSRLFIYNHGLLARLYPHILRIDSKWRPNR